MNSHKDPQPGADLLMHLKASSDLAEIGFSRDVKLLHTESCIACNGTGSDTKNLIPERVCHKCRGSGHIRVKRTVEVKVPPGIKNGMRLRLKGLGEAGDYGAPCGDLFIEINYKKEGILDKIRRFIFRDKINDNTSSIETIKKTEKKLERLEETGGKLSKSFQENHLSINKENCENSNFDLKETKENIKKYYEEPLVKKTEDIVTETTEISREIPWKPDWQTKPKPKIEEGSIKSQNPGLKSDLKKPEKNISNCQENEFKEITTNRIEEEIKEIRLIVPSYAINPNIPSRKKIPYYWNITCCKSCWSCYISSDERTYRCVKHNINNHFNGYCDGYRYNKIQPPE
jgi:hypothetical protein